MSQKLSIERLDQVADSQALFADIINKPSPFTAMTGPMPGEPSAEMILSGQTTAQTDPGMPIVRAVDALPRRSGSLKISMDVYTQPKVKPFMGNAYAEGNEFGGKFDQLEFNINLARFPYDTGTKLDRQVVKYDIPGLSKACALSSPERWIQQLTTINMFSGRGIEDHDGWTIPTAEKDDFGEITVNPVKAPARACHFRWNQSAGSLDKVSVSGGEFVIDTGDGLTTDLLNTLITQQAALPWFPTAVNFAQSKVSSPEPTWLALVPMVALPQFVTRSDYRSLVASMNNRAANLGSHPLFRFSRAEYGNFLIMPVPWNVFWNSGADVKYCASGSSQTESTAKVPAAFAANGFIMTRIVVVGASCLAQGFGTLIETSSPVDIQEVKKDYNFRSGLASSVLAGCDKIQYQRYWQTGQDYWCDRGAITIDFAMKLGQSNYNPHA